MGDVERSTTALGLEYFGMSDGRRKYMIARRIVLEYCALTRRSNTGRGEFGVKCSYRCAAEKTIGDDVRR